MRFAIVDIETTGTRLSQDRIVEIGVVIVENNVVKKVFTTFINPKQYIPRSITELTGISTNDVRFAPEFKQIAVELAQLLENSIFVAHNAAFDYGFIGAEFERIGINFQAKTLCTVRLSRKLFPHYRRHSLSHIIERFQIATPARHRALADAEAVWSFLQVLPKHFATEVIDKTIKEIIQTQRIPPQLSTKLIQDLPKAPGVYIFYDQDNTPLYIGKSINIHDRVKQHLQASSRSSKELHIFTNLAHIEAIETAGELSALLLESTLIKERFPIYNRQLRKTQKMFVLNKKLTTEHYFTLEHKYRDIIDSTLLPDIMGVFSSQQQALNYLEFISSKYGLCQKLLQLQKGSGPCFHYHLKKCKGACIQKEAASEYNVRLLEAFKTTRIAQWPYPGPITITEQSANGHLQEKITIDQWCIVKHEKGDSLSLFPESRKVFNLDEYKIIQNHLKRLHHQHKKQLENEEQSLVDQQ